MDPRKWDLEQMLAAFETTMRQNSKDDAAWRRTHAGLTAEPKEVREARRRDAAAGRPAQSAARRSVADAEAMLAQFAASDARYGAG